MPKVNKLIFHNFIYLVRPSVRLRFARIINSYAVDWSVGLFLFNFLCLLSFIGFLFRVRSKDGAKLLLLVGLCVPQFWNDLRMRGFHELNSAVNSASRNMKIARQFGITHRAILAIKLIIRHPLQVVGRQTVLFDENAQFSFFFFLSRN